MIRVGLTGGIGSGKSTIKRIFELLNIPVFESDREGRLILQDGRVKAKLIDIFGLEIAGSDGHIDRKKLAATVFSDTKKLHTLNSIVHPEVRKRFESWVSSLNDSPPYVINEAAILFESGVGQTMDYTINVNAPVEERIRRVMLRDSTNRAQVVERIDNQLTDAERQKLATWTIVNDEEHPVIPQVLEIDWQLRSKII